jgi:hypothetical protein
MIATRKIFLASSEELEDDRRQFEIFIARENKSWVKQGVFLELVLWEDFLDAVSQTRLQDEYHRAIRSCDIFVMLFFTKVGRYTEAEFATAFGQFKATSRPFLFTYFKTAPHNAGRADLQSLWAFQDKLKELGHFPTEYANADQLKLHFRQQLDKLAANGFSEFQPDRGASAAPGGSSFEAKLKGDGAIAQGDGAIAVGAGGQFTQIVKIEGPASRQIGREPRRHRALRRGAGERSRRPQPRRDRRRGQRNEARAVAARRRLCAA